MKLEILAKFIMPNGRVIYQVKVDDSVQNISEEVLMRAIKGYKSSERNCMIRNGGICIKPKYGKMKIVEIEEDSPPDKLFPYEGATGGKRLVNIWTYFTLYRRKVTPGICNIWNPFDDAQTIKAVKKLLKEETGQKEILISTERCTDGAIAKVLDIVAGTNINIFMRFTSRAVNFNKFYVKVNGVEAKNFEEYCELVAQKM